MSILANWGAISELVLPPVCTFLTNEVAKKIELLTSSPPSFIEGSLQTVPNFSSFDVTFRSIKLIPPNKGEEKRSSCKKSLTESLLLTDNENVADKNREFFGSAINILDIEAPDLIFFNELPEDEKKLLFCMEDTAVYIYSPAIKQRNASSASESKMEGSRRTPYYGKLLNEWHRSTTKNGSLSKLSSAIQGWSLSKFSKPLLEKDLERSQLLPSASRYSSPLDFQIDIKIELEIECEIIAKGSPSIDIPGFGIPSIVSLAIEERLTGVLVDIPLRIAVIGIEEAMKATECMNLSLFVSTLKHAEGQPITLKLETIFGDQDAKNTLKTKKLSNFYKSC